MKVLMRRSVIACDQQASLVRPVELPTIPQIGSEIHFNSPDSVEPLSLPVVRVVYLLDSEFVAEIDFEPDAIEPTETDVTLDEILVDYTHWTVEWRGVGDPSAMQIEQSNFRSWPPRDESDFPFSTVLLDRIMASDGMSPDEIDRVLSSLKPDVIDRLTKANLQKLRVEGRIQSLCDPGYRLKCKVLVWDRKKESPVYENLHSFSRVPRRGEDIEIHSACYRVANVRHTDPLFGFDALLMLIPVADAESLPPIGVDPKGV